MTSQATLPVNLCACGCGTEISPGATWARGHFRRGEGTFTPVPGPGEAPDLDDLAPPDPFGPVPRGYGVQFVGGPESAELFDELGGQADELDHDPAPASLRDGPPRPAGPPKVTSALRRDINAKISMPLEAGGQLWKARDPWCGGRFVEQRPAIANALTDIVCQSPDLIDFFTGPAGGFMIYLKLAAALWPVAEIFFASHIFGHGHGKPGEQPRQAAAPEDLRMRYAA